MNPWRKIKSRCRALLGKKRLDAEMEEEMRSHIELRTQANLSAGMNPEEARYAAMRQFGGKESIQEECREQRGFRWLEVGIQNFIFAFRQLRKNPGFAAVTIVSLALGLTIAATTFAIVNAYLLRSLPYPTANRLYHVMYAPPGPYEPRGMTALDWKSLSDVVEDTISPGSVPFYVTDDGAIKMLRGLRVPPGFIRGLGVQATIGRTFVPEEFDAGGGGVAMISDPLWRSRFGADPQIIGRVFPVQRDELGEEVDSLRIVGVLPPGFWFGGDSSATVDVLTPLRTPLRTYMIRLREGVPVAYAAKRITEAARRVGSDFRPDWTGVHLESVHVRYVANIRPVLVGVSIAVAILLVLVCANVAVLSLLRAMRRRKEVAVRIALGSGWKHIMLMLTAETCVICGVALVAGLGATTLALRFLTPLVEAQLGRPSPAGPSIIQLDSTVLVGLGISSLLIALSLAFIPLLSSWKHRLAEVLRSQGISSSDGPFMRKLRNSLIAFEIAGSLVLLVGGGLMIRSTVNMVNADLGFDPEKVMRVGIRLPSRSYTDALAQDRFFNELTARFPQQPGSSIVLMSSFPAFYPANTHLFEATPSKIKETPAGLTRVGAGYFKLYEIKLKAGREFAVSDRLRSEPVAIVSETLARQLWGETSAIGQQIRIAEGDTPGSAFASWRTIVGVAGDIRQGYEDSDLRDIFIPFSQAPGRFASVLVRTDQSTLFWDQAIRGIVSKIEPYAQISPAKTIPSEDRKRAGTQFLTSMLTAFAIFALLLALLGIYGVTTYAVQQREREIAVRVAIGADRGNIVRLFLKEGSRLLAVGMGLSFIGIFGVIKVLKSRIYGVEPFDWLTLTAAFTLMAVAGLSAIWWPAKRAALKSPMIILKEG